MNYFSRKPIVFFAVAWVVITGAWLVVGLSTDTSSMANLIASMLLLGGLILGLYRYHHTNRLKTVYQSVLPEEMYLNVKKIRQGENDVWYAQLRLESSPYDNVDIVFSVPETDWLPRISRNEKVKVYRGKKGDEIIIETKYGLLTPTGVIGLGPTSLWH